MELICLEVSHYGYRQSETAIRLQYNLVASPLELLYDLRGHPRVNEQLFHQFPFWHFGVTTLYVDSGSSNGFRVSESWLDGLFQGPIELLVPGSGLKRLV
jgi:hypothetical protein